MWLHIIAGDAEFNSITAVTWLNKRFDNIFGALASVSYWVQTYLWNKLKLQPIMKILYNIPKGQTKPPKEITIIKQITSLQMFILQNILLFFFSTWIRKISQNSKWMNKFGNHSTSKEIGPTWQISAIISSNTTVNKSCQRKPKAIKSHPVDHQQCIRRL